MNFPIRPYTKSELARAYAPGLTPHSATNRLASWIAFNRPLTTALKATGYRPQQRIFTTRQVQLIVDHFGEPVTTQVGISLFNVQLVALTQPNWREDGIY